MKIFPSVFTFLFIGFGQLTCWGQRLAFDRVPPPQGLHPTVICGVQDLNGYMWLGTYQSALRRYDGYNYTLYANDPQNPNSLGGRSRFVPIARASFGSEPLDMVSTDWIRLQVIFNITDLTLRMPTA